MATIINILTCIAAIYVIITYIQTIRLNKAQRELISVMRDRQNILLEHIMANEEYNKHLYLHFTNHILKDAIAREDYTLAQQIKEAHNKIQESDVINRK